MEQKKNLLPQHYNIHFNIILPSRPGSSKLSYHSGFPTNTIMYFLPHACYMSRPSYLFLHPNDIWRAARFTNLLTMQPIARHFRKICLEICVCCGRCFCLYPSIPTCLLNNYVFSLLHKMLRIFTGACSTRRKHEKWINFGWNTWKDLVVILGL
jgi:hypothetical protein